MRAAIHATVLSLLVVLLLGGISGESSPVQGDSPLSQEKLSDAFRALTSADLTGASHSDIVQLAGKLNQALGLMQAGNDNASSDLSSEIVSRAMILKSDAQNDSLRVRTLSYSTALLAAVLSSAVIMEGHWIEQTLRKRLSKPRPKR